MEITKSLSTITTKEKDPTAVHVFFVWYNELCRRLTIRPTIKPVKSKCQTVLDFVAEKLKLEEWNLVINALRLDTSLHVIAIRSRMGNFQFLYEVDTEEKVKKMEKKYGLIWTAYVLNQTVKSLSNCLRNTQVLSYLELDGLPLFTQYLEALLQALKRNKTLKTLSFVNSCDIEDVGCQLICDYLRNIPNVEVLNLSGCNLTSISGEYLAKLIKFQQINRSCESWHHSLRYTEPVIEKMCGIKRITINSNPNFGDAGLNLILDELDDDLWVKALDVQKCGITDSVAERILDVVEYNKVLEIVDLRQNQLLDVAVVEKVIEVFFKRQPFGCKSEFQWGQTARTLLKHSASWFTTKTNSLEKLHKAKSAPIKQAYKNCDLSIRKIKTLSTIQKNDDGMEQQKGVESGGQLRLLGQMKKLEIILPAIAERKDMEQSSRVSESLFLL
ncbi:unnamed protein product [Ceutorhynchus assimilis]|uniref:Uncharacterized protein n=1 Tax=Ceutorhynchus assimilis TaxID=467358 RepID=A0A9N9MRB3_9CUCU|nr:unnamed protein product [Ceutorhynchus assimilis]